MSNWDVRQKIENETRALLPDLLPRVAGFLGDGYWAEQDAEHNWQWIIETPTVVHGATLRLSVRVSQDDPQRLVFGVDLPQGWYQYRSYSTKYPVITVWVNRSAVAIANDVSRRLLPNAVAFFTGIAKMVASYVQAQDDTEVLHARLVEVGRGLIRPAPDRNSSQPRTQIALSGSLHADYGHGYLSGYVHSKGATLELHLPAAVAERVVALLATVREEIASSDS